MSTSVERTRVAGRDGGKALSIGLRRQPWVRHTVYWLGVAVALLHMAMNYSTWLSTQWQATLHFIGLGLMCVLLYPARRNEKAAASRAWLVFDLLFGVAVVVATTWLIAAEDAIYQRGVYMSAGEQLMALVTIVGAIEFTRRTTGWIIPLLIVLAAFLPALLYFLSVAFFVRIEAKRLNFAVEVRDEQPGMWQIMRQGGLVFVLPISVLITLLVIGFTPTYAAGLAIVTVVLSSWLTPRRMGLGAILDALALGSRNMITTGLLLVAVNCYLNMQTHVQRGLIIRVSGRFIF